MRPSLQFSGALSRSSDPILVQGFLLRTVTMHFKQIGWCRFAIFCMSLGQFEIVFFTIYNTRGQGFRETPKVKSSLGQKNMLLRDPLNRFVSPKRIRRQNVFLSKKVFFRSQKKILSNFHQLFFGKETLRNVSSNELDWPNPFKRNF